MTLCFDIFVLETENLNWLFSFNYTDMRTDWKDFPWKPHMLGKRSHPWAFLMPDYNKIDNLQYSISKNSLSKKNLFKTIVYSSNKSFFISLHFPANRKVALSGDDCNVPPSLIELN